MTMDTTSGNAANDENAVTTVLATNLRATQTAELSSYETIVENRMKVIDCITSLKDESETFGEVLLDSISDAPWLLNPFWSPIICTQLLSTVKFEFEKFVKDRIGMEDTGTNRPDFMLSADDFGLQIIAIKPLKHKLKNDEWDRIQLCIDEMDNFLNLEEHQCHKDLFKRFRVILVCDEINLSGSQHAAFKSLRQQKTVEHLTWTLLLERTTKIHQEFLSEIEKEKYIFSGLNNLLETYSSRRVSFLGVVSRISASLL